MPDDSQWVHERDYGENPIPELIGAVFYLAIGAVQLVIALGMRLFRGK